MKKNLVTVIVVGVLGVVVSYLLTNMFLPAIENASFKVLTSNPTYTLSSPDDEIFNYRAVNPTVEVYVGQCTEYNAEGICIDNGLNDTASDTTDETTDDNTTPEENSKEEP